MHLADTLFQCQLTELPALLRSTHSYSWIYTKVIWG
uniref:Uncharacterized protein n=1 Tax=Anguilla anguilla TaxID=7936 RepID=A0A0E9RE57_ANGAN